MTTIKNDSSKKISKESALEQIENLLDYYGIEKEDIEIEDGPEAVQTMFNTLTRAIMKGCLEINLDGGDLSIIQHLKRPVNQVEKITYSDRIGKAKIAMDTAGKKTNSRQNEFMATMGDIPVSVLIKLKGFDSTIYSRLATVFSMV